MGRPCRESVRAVLSVLFLSYLCSHYTEYLFMPTRKAIWKSMNTYPICDTPLYNLAQQSVSLRYRNRAEITVLMREQNSYPYFYRVGAKGI